MRGCPFFTSLPILRAITFAMKHEEQRWSSDLGEWFCLKCGRASDQPIREEAFAEIELFACELPVIEN